MAYARYGLRCDWYIFWESTKADEERATAGSPKPKEEETLAIWLKDHRSVGPRFTYAQVRDMLESRDLSCIPGSDEASRTLLLKCMTEFVKDVDDEHAR
jgi:hypothetical protein